MALWFESALLTDGWADSVRISLSGGLIASIERNAAPGPGDERFSFALPGLCNVHSHAFQRAMAGLTETRAAAADNFWSWREVMYRFLDRLDPDDIEAIAALAYAEMLENGFTRVGEFHYLHHGPDGRTYANRAETAERIAAAAVETGIALTLLPVYYAQGGFGAAPPTAGQRRFVTRLDEFARLHEASRAAVALLEDSVVGVAPHSLRAVTPEYLTAVEALAPQGPIHIHAAEQAKEVLDCIAWSGKRPVAWLLAHGVDARWTLVHATHMTDEETRQLAASGAVAGLCPSTEANLGDGFFQAQAFLAAGGRIGVGTDSNVEIDAPGELRALEYTQRLLLRSRNILSPGPAISTGTALFTAAMAGGSRSLHSAPGLLQGAPADIVSLATSHPSLASRVQDRLLDSWIFTGARAVQTVWRRGRKVVEGGEHVRGPAIRARYRKTLTRLLAE